MKQIIVISDTHGNQQAVADILCQYPQAEAYIHCGDSEVSSQELYPFITVKGNNDYCIDNLFSIVKVNNFKAYVTHGHKVFLWKNSMIEKARAHGCNFFIHGHTHRPFYEKVEGIHLLCPGSLSYPRTAAGETFARIVSQDDFMEDFQVEILSYKPTKND